MLKIHRSGLSSPQSHDDAMVEATRQLNHFLKLNRIADEQVVSISIHQTTELSAGSAFQKEPTWLYTVVLYCSYRSPQ